MSNKPSRSEIESALSGRTRKSEPSPKKQVQPDFDFGEPPRRQQVIGGDLTGVNKRQKPGLFSRYSDVSVANWVAGFVVLMIVAAFFWPQPQESVLEVTKTVDESRVVAVNEDGVEESQNTVGAINFSRPSDVERAEAYREQDLLDIEINDLLDQASTFIQKRQFTRPTDNNAVLIYQKVLAISPRNADAREGLSKIREHFLVNGLNAVNADNLALASSNLGRLELVDKQSDEYSELSDAIAEARTLREIKSLLVQANDSLTAGNLILPARESALAYFNQVLQLDEQNQTALDGLQNIADSYISKANDSVLSGDFEASAAHLATVSLIAPEHKSIPLIEAMITRAKPLAEAAALQAQEREAEAALLAAATPIDTQVQVEEQPPEQAGTTTASDSTNSQFDTQVSQNQTANQPTANQNTADEQTLLNGLEAYYTGDYALAASSLQPLADKGIARAQLRLAYMHFLGRGFKRDRAKADSIVRAALPAIRKFANEGRGWAQSDLGSLYEDGLVLPRDYGEAVYWYRTSAEQGYPGAQTNLGIMYARGRGVTPSRKTAIEWFQRAATQGDSVAKRNLEALGVN